jgi:hypothetical protein
VKTTLTLLAAVLAFVALTWCGVHAIRPNQSPTLQACASCAAAHASDALLRAPCESRLDSRNSFESHRGDHP